MIKAVIFDFYGVLLTNKVEHTFIELGGDYQKHEARIDELNRQYDLGLINRDELHGQMGELVGVSMQKWRAAREAHYGVDPRMLRLVDELEQKTAILSNSTIASLSAAAGREALSHFDELVLSADEGIIKPDRRIYGIAAQRLSVEPEECLFIDDVQANVDGAIAAGMQAVLFKDFASFSKELKVLLKA